jgi:DNA-binding Xre family transcriptional regulator
VRQFGLVVVARRGRRIDMAYNYNKLWKLLIDKGMLKKDLIKATNMTASTMAKLGKNQAVSMDVLGRICLALDCNIGDIVDVVKDQPKETETQN